MYNNNNIFHNNLKWHLGLFICTYIIYKVINNNIYAQSIIYKNILIREKYHTETDSSDIWTDSQKQTVWPKLPNSTTISATELKSDTLLNAVMRQEQIKRTALFTITTLFYNITANQIIINTLWTFNPSPSRN